MAEHDYYVKKLLQNKDNLSGSELLSGVTKDDRIMPVITLVLYLGKEAWDGPATLYEMMGIDENWVGADMIRKFLPDYRIHLVDARNIEDLNLYQTSLQQVFGMLKYNKDKEKLYRYTKDNIDKIRRMDRDSVEASLAFLGEQKRLLKILKSSEEQEGVDMCQAIDDLIADGEARGEAHGKAQFAKLVSILLADNRQDLLAQAAEDEQLCRQLFAQYQLNIM